MTEIAVFAETALLPGGWARDVLLEVDAAGSLRRVSAGAQPGDASRAAGPVLPGFPNLHHAFQRAMGAGRTGRAQGGWR